MLAETTGLPLEKLRNMGANSEVAPDSGTTSGSRQTLITGEAVRMAAAELRADLDGAGGDLSALEGLEYSAEFFDPTDKLGADKPNPKSHVAYGFATHVVILDGEGRVKEVYAAHDSGKVVNPTSIQGQIEGACSWAWATPSPRTSPQGLRAPGQIRHPGADAGRPDSRHPRHLCGEGGAAPLRLRGQGHRRDRHYPHRSGGPGGLLRP
ncbi:MAG: molybdopterin cofactor-binding domain-containing protein [Flavonifractor plautii]